MSLLPKNTTPTAFSTPDYWTDFFSNRNTKEFEWYANFRSLSQLLTRLCKDKSGTKFLHIGCGNSTLGFDLFKFGYLNVINIDLNQLVINQMQTKYKDYLNDTFKFMRMDVFNLEFDENQFNVVLDKGTLDALASDNTEATNEKLYSMFNQIERVLAPLGQYICVSLLQEHILDAFINWVLNKSKFSYIVRIYKLKKDELELSQTKSKKKFPVFVIVATKLKLKTEPGSKSLYELVLNEDYDSKPIRSLDHHVLIDLIKEIHSLNLIKAHVKNNSLQPNEELCFELFEDTKINEYKYKFFINEQFSRDNKQKFAVFIVPLGREKEYLFSTREGRREVCRLSLTQRLVFVTLNANYGEYPKSMELMQNELSPKVMEFAPSAHYANPNQKIPFLTIQDQEREVRYRGTSGFSGDYGVYDVKTEHNGKEVMLRQLIFDSNKQLIQSECKLKQVRRKKKFVNVVDHSYLACLHHGAIISGICLFKYYYQSSLEEKVEKISLENVQVRLFRVLLIGLGGGCLVNFLNHNLRLDENTRVEFDVVEIDETMVTVARNWFELNEKLREDKFKITIHIQDGLAYLREFKESNHYDLIIFDIDNKSASSGLSCPPQEFLEQPTLDSVKRILKDDYSLFILNLAARNNSIKQSMENHLKANFNQVNKYRIPDETNNIFYCTNSQQNLKNDFKDKEKSLCDRIKKFIELFKLTIDIDEVQSIIDVVDFVSYLN